MYQKEKNLMNAFFDLHLKYLPFRWMCHSHTNNRKIDRFHESCLTIYKDKQSSLRSYLKRIALFLFTWKNVQIWLLKCLRLAITFYFPYEQNFWNKEWISLQPNTHSQFSQPLVKSVYHGTESISYLGSNIQEILPNIY